MNIMKAAIKVQVRAYSRRGNRHKSAARAEVLRAEIDAACREARNDNNSRNRRHNDSAPVSSY